MYEPAGRQSANLAFLWPAFIAASASDMSALIAKHFANLAVGSAGAPAPEPKWSTSHTVALELNSVRLRDFTIDEDQAHPRFCARRLRCTAPPSPILHLDIVWLRHCAAPGDGCSRPTGVPQRPDMRFRGIDDYLADLNVLVDHIGAPVDLIGLCQGGWMALAYAARFPAKVCKLVLAGAPIDIAAAPSALSELAGTSPMAVFDELVRIGDGIVPGRKVLKFWGVDTVAAEDLRRVLQTDELPGSAGFAKLEADFRDWYAWTTDLPGSVFPRSRRATLQAQRTGAWKICCARAADRACGGPHTHFSACGE